MPLTPVVYPNSPLRLLTVELRLVYEPAVNRRDVRDSFASDLRRRFPIISEEEAPGTGEEGEPLRQIRLTATDRKVSVSLNAHALSLIVAGDAYRGLSSFAPVVVEAFRALSSAVERVSVVRVGLRYLNEIRLAAGEYNPADWEPWVRPELLAVASMIPGAAVALTGHVHFTTDQGTEMLVQYADARGASVVSKSIPISLAEVEDADFFVIDLDGGWEPVESDSLTDVALETKLFELHEPLRAAFEWCLTEASRARFMEGGKS